MNLLIKILKSSQRGKPRPWYSHRYTGRFIALFSAVLAYQYYSYVSPQDYQSILEQKTIRVGYLKSPNIAFEFGTESAGFELDIIKHFAKQKNLKVKTFKVNRKDAVLGLNTNRYDILIGHFPSSTLLEHDKKKLSKEEEFYKEHFKETIPWLESSSVLFEHKELKKPKSRKITEDQKVYVNIDFPKQFKELKEANIIALPESNLIKKVNNNDISYGITTINKLRINQKYIPQLRTIKRLDDVIPLVWRLPFKNSDALLNELNIFLNNVATKKFIYKRKRIWISKFKNIKFLDTLTLSRRIKTILPELRPIFESAGKKENVDWLLIAALSYQESSWDVKAVSPTKVRGIMQLTKSTAEALGVNDRTDIYDSIHAATRYLKELEQRIPVKAKREDRIWMAVAAYNLGISRVLEAYKNLRDENIKDISWPTIAYQLTLRSNDLYRDKYTNGRRAVIYVERIKELRKVLRYYSGDSIY